MSNNEAFNYKKISTSGQVSPRPVTVGGIFCNSNAGTASVTLYDSPDAGGNIIIGPFVPVAGQSYPCPAATSVGLYVALSAAADLTLFWA